MSETPSPAETGTGARAGWRRWLFPLLVASLAFNLVVIGAAIAERFRPDRVERIRTPRATELLPRNFFIGLSRERREALKVVFQERHKVFREERRALREAAERVADALAREPYDPEQVRKAIAEYGDATSKLVDLGLSLAEDVVEKLSTQERQALAEHIRQRAASPPPRRKKE